MVYLFLADGFEETEALCPLDLLRRANVEVKTVGVGGRAVTGAHHITVLADIEVTEMVLDKNLEMLILPGGMPGTQNLDGCVSVHQALDYANATGIYIAAICAAPMILGKRKMLVGKKAICYPGYEKYLLDAEISKKSVVTDENIITAKGMGVATPFGLTLVSLLCGESVAEQIEKSIMSE